MPKSRSIGTPFWARHRNNAITIRTTTKSEFDTNGKRRSLAIWSKIECENEPVSQSYRRVRPNARMQQPISSSHGTRPAGYSHRQSAFTSNFIKCEQYRGIDSLGIHFSTLWQHNFENPTPLYIYIFTIMATTLDSLDKEPSIFRTVARRQLQS